SAGRAPVAADAALLTAIESLLDNRLDDKALLAEMLTLPSVARISEQFEQIDTHAIVAARESLQKQIAERFADKLEQLADDHAATGAWRFNVTEAGRRRVHGLALSLLASLGVERVG